MESAIDLLQDKYKSDETHYWVLCYTFLSLQQLRNLDEIIVKLCPLVRDISYQTYYRKRRDTIVTLSSVLWGYTSQDSLVDLERWLPQ